MVHSGSNAYKQHYQRVAIRALVNRAQTINSHFGVEDIRRAVFFASLMALAAQ